MDLALELPCYYVDIPVKAEKTMSQVWNSSTATGHSGGFWGKDAFYI